MPSQEVLTDSNAIARYVGGSTGAAAALDVAGWHVSGWMEWEEIHLRPAVYTGAPVPLEAELVHLDKYLPSSDFLVGAAVTLADVVVFATLLPLTVAPVPGAPAQGRPVRAFLERMGQLPAVRAGMAAALGSGGLEALAAVFRQDAAAAVGAQPRRPVPGQRNILITSALPYVNNVPHLGNIIGCVLSADCYARYCRARGYNTVFICGTDEYGTATETKALEEGLTCQETCDKYHAVHAQIYEWFDIAFDKFGRTPTWQQTEIAQAIFRSLERSGRLAEHENQQLYSEAAGKFLADRFVSGTCPYCAYEDARGDQCDSCGKLLECTALINPRCKLTGTTPVLRATTHLFLDLPALSPQLQAYIDRSSRSGGWSSNCVQTTAAWMRDGLKERCITRDLSWGTPVPRPGYEDKVFYVWFDAPIGYISITANYLPDWEAWWRNPEDVELVQFMGKDNVPFHTVIFPATLLGTGERWTLMSRISVTEYLNYEGGKFSKSRGVGVFGNDARDTGIPVEVWRYLLLSLRPENADADFKWSDLAAKNNSELLANLGNFVNRALTFVAKQLGGVVAGRAGGKAAGPLARLVDGVAPLVAQYVAAMDGMRFKEAIRIVMAISAVGNKFIQDYKPWVVLKEDAAECGALLSGCAGLVVLLAALLEPFMPSITTCLLEQLALPRAAIALSDAFLAPFLQHAATLAPADSRHRDDPAGLLADLVPAGHAIGAPKLLFREIGKDEAEALRARFAGTQADRASAAAPAGAAAATNQAAKPSPKAVDVSRLDLRVGLIRRAWEHPDAESLYVEEVDCGEAEPRQVVSGLRKYMPLAALEGRRVVLVANMKPAAMRGVRSQAMVLCASSPDGAQVEFVEPPAGAAPGERVSVEGFPGEPDAQLAPKKRVFEGVQPDLASNAARVACYRGIPLATAQGPCTVASIAGGSIR
ncbi:hypothetical protein WJX81_000084 [Elliptochloris bilobata]|uniref:methionine--tRNA ligase n=1 Tax=Elliptochloris bilobata TaxID=381761 RepID=A0AAW1QWB7_9CHLO